MISPKFLLGRTANLSRRRRGKSLTGAVSLNGLVRKRQGCTEMLSQVPSRVIGSLLFDNLLVLLALLPHGIFRWVKDCLRMLAYCSDDNTKGWSGHRRWVYLCDQTCI